MAKEQKRIYIVYDYWVDSIVNKVYAIYVKNGRLYFMESELKK